jgi:hypothetical protein
LTAPVDNRSDVSQFGENAMNDRELQASKVTNADASGGKAWTKPSVGKLRAGAAENIPGFAVLDGPLETIGS